MNEIERVALHWWFEHFGGAEAFTALQMNPGDHLAAVLPSLRNDRGWDQAALAARLNALGWPADRTLVNRIETRTITRRRRVSVDELFLLAEAFELPISVLTGSRRSNPS